MIDWTKPLQTKSGLDVEVLRRLWDGRWVGVVLNRDGSEHVVTWMPNGSSPGYGDHAGLGLKNTPEPLMWNEHADAVLAYALGFRVQVFIDAVGWNSIGYYPDFSDGREYRIHRDDEARASLIIDAMREAAENQS